MQSKGVVVQIKRGAFGKEHLVQTITEYDDCRRVNALCVGFWPVLFNGLHVSPRCWVNLSGHTELLVEVEIHHVLPA